MLKGTLLHLVIFCSLSPFAIAQHEVNLREINVEGHVANRERPDAGSRGERSDRPSPSKPSVGTPPKQPALTLVTTTLAPDEEESSHLLSPEPSNIQSTAPKRAIPTVLHREFRLSSHSFPLMQLIQL